MIGPVCTDVTVKVVSSVLAYQEEMWGWLSHDIHIVKYIVQN